MKTLCIGDPHFKVNNLDDMKILTREIMDHLEKTTYDCCVVMGDILDRHETIHVHALMAATNFLTGLAKKLKTYVLIGNHDRPNNSNFLTDEHPFTSLKELDNMIIVDKVIQVEDMVFVPYVPPGRFFEAIQNIDLDTVFVIFAHQEFKGVKMGTITSTDGDVWPENHPIVISGHIHQYQEIQDNLLYIGTPMQHHFGDPDDNSISAFVLDGEEGVFEEERIYLNVPKRRVIKIGHDELANWVATDQTYNGYTKLVVVGPQEQMQVLTKSGILKNIPPNVRVSLLVEDTGVKSEAPTIHISRTTFKEILYEILDNNDDASTLKETFSMIFNEQPVKKKPIVTRQVGVPKMTIVRKKIKPGQI